MVLPWLLPTLLVIVAITAVFAAGVGLVLSVLNVYFRDLQYLVGILPAAVVLRHADRLPDLARSRLAASPARG